MNMSETNEIEEMEENYPPSDYVWCLHCESTYKAGTHRKVAAPKEVRQIAPEIEFMEECAYEDCDGDAIMDAWSWGKVSTLNKYPEIPEHGKVYPLYPPK